MRILRVAVLAAALVGAGSIGATAAQYTIVLQQMKFGPVPATLHPGDIIVWRNDDILRHSATARDKSFDLRLAPGKKGTMTASKPGSFPFYCIYHATMRGVLKIAAK